MKVPTLQLDKPASILSQKLWFNQYPILRPMRIGRTRAFPQLKPQSIRISETFSARRGSYCVPCFLY
jgi:hypothetical protein